MSVLLLPPAFVPAVHGGMHWSDSSFAVSGIREAQRTLDKADRMLDEGRAESAMVAYRESVDRYTLLQRMVPGDSALQQAIGSGLAHGRAMLSQLSESVEYHAVARETAPAPAGVDLLPEPLAEQNADEAAPAGLARPPPVSGAAAPDLAPVRSDADQAHVSWEDVSADIRRLLARGHRSEALHAARQAFAASPDSVRRRLMLCSLLIENGAFGDALIVLEDMPDPARGEEPALLLRAAAYYGEGDPIEALLVLDHILTDVNPRSPQAYLNLAWLRYHMDPRANLREAQAFYRFALRLGARSDEALASMLGF